MATIIIMAMTYDDDDDHRYVRCMVEGNYSSSVSTVDTELE
jgi:hypothetical protein